MKQPAYEKPEGSDAAELLTVDEETVVELLVDELLTKVERVVGEEAEVDDSELLTGADELLNDEEEEVVLEVDELSSVLLLLDTEEDSVLEADVVAWELLLDDTSVVDWEVADERLSDDADELDVWLWVSLAELD